MKCMQFLQVFNCTNIHAVDQVDENNYVLVYPFIGALCDSKAWGLARLPKCQGTACMTYIQNSYTALLHSIMAGRINYRNYKCHNKLTFFVLVALFVDVQVGSW